MNKSITNALLALESRSIDQPFHYNLYYCKLTLYPLIDRTTLTLKLKAKLTHKICVHGKAFHKTIEFRELTKD